MKGVAATTLSLTGADRFIGKCVGSRKLPLILAYHRVVDSIEESSRGSIPAMLVTVKMLESHLDWVSKRFKFVSLDEIGDGLEDGAGFSGPVAAVTFDDGYRDTYFNAFPLLKRKGIPGAFFLVTDLVGTDRLQIHDRLYLLLKMAFSQSRLSIAQLQALMTDLELSPEQIARIGQCALDPYAVLRTLMHLPQSQVGTVINTLSKLIEISSSLTEGMSSLTWEMVRKMHSDGMTIGSHTSSHAFLTNESAPKMFGEAADSRRALTARLGAEVRHFAYPDGRVNPDVVTAVEASGYRFGYHTCLRRDRERPLLTIPRKVLWENSCVDLLGRFSPAIMSCQANWVFDFPHFDSSWYYTTYNGVQAGSSIHV